MRAWYEENLPRPDDMKPEAYRRNIAARAYDVARYCLFFGIPTGVGQVVSIRTLEKQVRRLKASVYRRTAQIWVTRSPQAVRSRRRVGWTATDSDEPVCAHADPIRGRRRTSREGERNFARVGDAKLTVVRDKPSRQMMSTCAGPQTPSPTRLPASYMRSRTDRIGNCTKLFRIGAQRAAWKSLMCDGFSNPTR